MKTVHYWNWGFILFIAELPDCHEKVIVGKPYRCHVVDSFGQCRQVQVYGHDVAHAGRLLNRIFCGQVRYLKFRPGSWV